MREDDPQFKRRVERVVTDTLVCRKVCAEALMNYLNTAGTRAEQPHLGLLMDAKDICFIISEFLIRKSTFYNKITEMAADIFYACYEDLKNFDSPDLKECANACLACAESCEEMARIA